MFDFISSIEVSAMWVVTLFTAKISIASAITVWLALRSNLSVRVLSACRGRDGLIHVRLRISPDTQRDSTVFRVKGRRGVTIHASSILVNGPARGEWHHEPAKSLLEVDWFVPRDEPALCADLFLSPPSNLRDKLRISLAVSSRCFPWGETRTVEIADVSDEKLASTLAVT